MKHRNFPTSPAPGNRINVHLPWGNKIADNSDDADRIASNAYFHMKERLGREPTRDECLSGPKPADNRSIAERMERDAFKPKKNDNPHPMDRLADSLPVAEQKYNPRER